MNLHEGDRVLVNVAPFIGSSRRAKESIPCTVLAAAEDQIQVRTEQPYRELALWISPDWVDRKLRDACLTA